MKQIIFCLQLHYIKSDTIVNKWFHSKAKIVFNAMFHFTLKFSYATIKLINVY